MVRAVLVLVTLLAGCGYEGVFVCDDDAQCRHGDEAGTCQVTGGKDPATGSASTIKYCAFPDTGCAMGKRWDAHAGEGYDKLCYGDSPAMPIDAGFDAQTDASADAARDAGGPGV